MARRPKLIVFSGLPGTGKSTLAREIAVHLGAVWLRVDSLEAAMVEAGLPVSFETGLAAYIGVREIASEQLRIGRDVVIDAVNAVEAARQMWRKLSEEFHAERYTVLIACTDPVEHRRRVEARPAATPPLPTPTWQEVRDREFQPWGEPILSIDSTRPVDRTVAEILTYCRGNEADV